MNATHPSLSDAAARFARRAQAFAGGPAGGDDKLLPELAEMVALLAEQPEWRVFVDATYNCGHQASTVLILRRLIDLSAYTGRVLIFYADAPDAAAGGVPEKLALMFAGIAPANIDDAVAAYGTCTNIRFARFARRAELTEAVAFGFTGGADDMSINFALQLKVRFFARIQPYLWDDPLSESESVYFESSRIEQPDGAHLYLLESCPAYQGCAIKPAGSEATTAAAWRWYCGQDFAPGLACRTRNLQAVLAACAAGTAPPRGMPLMWPVYGLQHFRRQAADMLLVLVLAALRLQAAPLPAILLCLFSPPAEPESVAPAEALALDLGLQEPRLPALQATIGDGRPGAARAGLDVWTRTLGAWIRDTCPGARLHVHRSFDPACGQWSGVGPRLAAALSHAPGAAVHVIELGPVPADMFNHCLAHARLPPVIEGQASANLLTSFGKPFLQILRPEHEGRHGYPCALEQLAFPHVAGEAGRVAATIRDLAPSACHPAEAAAGYCAGIEQVARFVQEAAAPDTEVVEYFASLGRHFRPGGHDKLLLALMAMREVLLAGEPS